MNLSRQIPGAMHVMSHITLGDRSGNVKDGGKPSLHRAGRKQLKKMQAKYLQRSLPRGENRLLREEQLITKFVEVTENLVQRDLIKRKQAQSAQDITGVPPLVIASLESKLAEQGFRGEPLQCEVSGREWIVFRRIA